MKTLFKIFLLILSTSLIQNKAFSYSKNSGKVSVTVSVTKTDKSDNKSEDAKTNASVSKNIESVTSLSKDNTVVSKTEETASVKDTSNEQSYSYDNNKRSSDDYYDRNNNFKNGCYYSNFKINKFPTLNKKLKNYIKNTINICKIKN